MTSNSERRRLQWQDPAYRAARAEKARAAWADPEKRARMTLAAAAAAGRATVKARVKAANSNPAKIARARATREAKNGGAYVSDKTLAAIAGYWNSPGVRDGRSARESAFLQTPEGRAKHARMNAARWAGHTPRPPEERRLITKLINGGMRGAEARAAARRFMDEERAP